MYMYTGSYTYLSYILTNMHSATGGVRRSYRGVSHKPRVIPAVGCHLGVEECDAGTRNDAYNM